LASQGFQSGIGREQGAEIIAAEGMFFDRDEMKPAARLRLAPCLPGGEEIQAKAETRGVRFNSVVPAAKPVLMRVLNEKRVSTI
jgi:hypothetical protein